MKNLLLIFMMLFAVDSIAQLDQREKGDVVSPALNKNPNFIQKTGWTIEAIDPINDTLCSVTPSSDNLSIETADVCNARVYQDINSADIRKARFAKETMTVSLKIQSMGYVKITLNVYKKAATTGTLTLLRTRSLENNSGVLLRNKKVTFDVVTEDLNFVANASLADSLRIEFTFEPTIVFPAGVAEVEVNDFRVFSSPMNYSPVLYNVNQTQATLLTNVGNVTPSTDLSTLTKDVNHTKGEGIYTLGADGITFLRDADVSSHFNSYRNANGIFSRVYLNGDVVSGENFSTSTAINGMTSASLSLAVRAGDKITFESSATGTSLDRSTIQILATVSVPAVATNKYREPVTKYLSSDITATTADIADFKFTDLVVGTRYRLSANAYFLFATDVPGENALKSSQGGLIISRFTGSSGNIQTQGTLFSEVEFTSTNPELSFSYTRSAHNLRGTGDKEGSYVTLKRIDSVMQAYLLESNIEKDVEQFHTDERKICDTCYKGGALYKRCFNSVAGNNASIGITGVTELVSANGRISSALGAFSGEMPYPYLGSLDNYAMLKRDGSVIRSMVTGITVTSGNYCVKYTK